MIMTVQCPECNATGHCCIFLQKLIADKNSGQTEKEKESQKMMLEIVNCAGTEHSSKKTGLPKEIF